MRVLAFGIGGRDAFRRAVKHRITCGAGTSSWRVVHLSTRNPKTGRSATGMTSASRDVACGGARVRAMNEASVFVSWMDVVCVFVSWMDVVCVFVSWMDVVCVFVSWMDVVCVFVSWMDVVCFFVSWVDVFQSWGS
jgi:hypothetical protein